MVDARTGLLFDERFLGHDTGAEAEVVMRNGRFTVEPEPHPSAIYITKRIKQFLDGTGLSAQMKQLVARAATEEELTAYHTAEYIAGLRSISQGEPLLRGTWGEVEPDTPLSAGSFEAALYAAGGAIEAVKSVMQGEVKNAYALLRPPGHHAMRNRAMGFCLFNNAVIAVEYVRRVLGVGRIMIVDWDVHHGNGTQDAFYSDPDVLFVSLHQQNWYPRLSGELEQVGSGKGVGYTVNIPLPAGTGDRGYRAAFEQLVVPIGLQFKPELMLISAGQDANWMDPLAQMMMTMDGYRDISQLMCSLAREVCHERLVMLQEGGYSATYVPYCTIAMLEPVTGRDVGLIDPNEGESEVEQARNIFTQETRKALHSARRWHRQWWSL